MKNRLQVWSLKSKCSEMKAGGLKNSKRFCTVLTHDKKQVLSLYNTNMEILSLGKNNAIVTTNLISV